MPLKKIKDKITNIAEGEILGDAAVNPEDIEDNNFRDFEISYETEDKPQKIKKKKTPKDIKRKEVREKPPITKKESRGNKKAISSELPNDGLIDGYQDILNLLGIKPSLNLNLEFTSEDLDYVEFTQTQPLGFDFDEVTDFISRVKYNLYKQEAALRQRESDIKRLASEVKKVEERMIAQNQAKELERMVGGMTEEERLIEENMDLKVQVNELTRQLKNGDKDITNALKKEIEALKAENDILKMTGKSSLPKVDFDDEEDDMFSDMLEEIGGLYEDE